MKPTKIFTLCLIAAIVLFLADRGLEGASEGPGLNKLFSLCVLFGVLLQFAVFASSGALRLRRLSLFWMIIALVLASGAGGLPFFDLSAVFFAGFAFSFVPTEPSASTD
ncbi:MAG: hypothetical protein P8N09_05090 [Planctomycetota bacterium]|nr:hypothetical protein [Planctomycetota bacterium]